MSPVIILIICCWFSSTTNSYARTFYENQHYPLSTYPNLPPLPLVVPAQPTLDYSSLQRQAYSKPAAAAPVSPAFRPAYHLAPTYNPPMLPPPLKQGPPNANMTKEQIEELQRQIQQWEIAIINQANSQPGYVWINAPQYGYYPPPQQNYPGAYPQPYPTPQYPPPQYPPPQYPPPQYPSPQYPTPQYPAPPPPSVYPGGDSGPQVVDPSATEPSSQIVPQVTESSPDPFEYEFSTTTKQPPTVLPSSSSSSQEPLTTLPSKEPSTLPPPPTEGTTESITTAKPTAVPSIEPPTTILPSKEPSTTTELTTESPTTSPSSELPITFEWSPSPSSTSGSTEITYSTSIVTTPEEQSSSTAEQTSSSSSTSTTEPIFTIEPISNTTDSETTISSSSSSTDYSTSPTNNSTSPTDISTSPTDISTSPTDNSTSPTDNSTSPTDNSTPSIVPADNTTSLPSTTENPLLKACKKPRGQFASESSCNKFVNCWDGDAVEQACPASLAFNEEKGYCDYPENVKCGNSSNGDGTGGSSDGNGTSTTSKCPSPYGTYRNTSNCAAFYVCVAGEPVDFVCPGGTYYNDELKVCDYPYRVNCSDIPTPAPETTSTEINLNATTAESVSSTGNISTESSSSSGSSVESTESSTLSSSSEIITTGIPESPVTPQTYPGSVDSVLTYNNSNLKKLPESIVNTGVRCYHSNIIRLTPDCSSVTICQEGSTYIVNCAHGTSFDAHAQRCIPAFRARC